MAYTEQGFHIPVVLEECLRHDSEQALFIALVCDMYYDNFVLVIVPITFCPFLFGTCLISLNVSQDLAYALQLVTTPWFMFLPLVYRIAKHLKKDQVNFFSHRDPGEERVVSLFSSPVIAHPVAPIMSRFSTTYLGYTLRSVLFVIWLSPLCSPTYVWYLMIVGWARLLRLIFPSPSAAPAQDVPEPEDSGSDTNVDSVLGEAADSV